MNQKNLSHQGFATKFFSHNGWNNSVRFRGNQIKFGHVARYEHTVGVLNFAINF